MPNFLVTITHKLEQQLIVSIEADDETEAEKLVQAKLVELPGVDLLSDFFQTDEWELEDEEFEIYEINEE